MTQGSGRRDERRSNMLNSLGTMNAMTVDIKVRPTHDCELGTALQRYVLLDRSRLLHWIITTS
jgi:hypothetical protein